MSVSVTGKRTGMVLLQSGTKTGVMLGQMFGTQQKRRLISFLLVIIVLGIVLFKILIKINLFLLLLKLSQHR
jgi:hypothetical protein